MPNVFLILSLVFLVISALLYFAPHLKLLNFVEYGSNADAARLNRYAAVRLLLPVAVSVLCGYIVALRHNLTVPLFFLVELAILATVVWINAGISRFPHRKGPVTDDRD